MGKSSIKGPFSMAFLWFRSLHVGAMVGFRSRHLQHLGHPTDRSICRNCSGFINLGTRTKDRKSEGVPMAVLSGWWFGGEKAPGHIEDHHHKEGILTYTICIYICVYIYIWIINIIYIITILYMYMYMYIYIILVYAFSCISISCIIYVSIIGR